MKKRIVFLLLLPFLALLFVPHAAAGEGERKLTLMVYMCGSNLETTCGSASEDMREMMDAMPAGREFALLVMTGGSDLPEGAGWFQQESAGIYEVAAGGRIRRIEQLPERNMGDGETLAAFLRFGQEQRPAERYALILWDHGGGPLEGVCWDEASDMDHLTLSEVTGALEASLTRKLDWIGFDACLMSSLEVAGEMAPYADYMIASQETEPASGWNYSFLRDLASDADGAETGRRIVDAYFEGQEDSRDILTLACTDLAAAGEAIAAMDDVFGPMSREMSEEEYLALSARRMTVMGFGKADPGFAATGYDLVDARDLVAGLERSGASEHLAAQLEKAVVYSRANEDGANGLTLYYPYANKTSYIEKWGTGYAALAFSPGYQEYVRVFGSLLTGESLFRWKDLLITGAAAEADGSFSFEMPLTEEQAGNVVSAQLLIIRDTAGSRLDRNCVLIASCRAEVGEDGVVRASWDGRCLYAEEEDGSLRGPVSFRQTDDGKLNAVTARYNLDDQFALEGQTVFMELDSADTAEYPEILRIRTWDEATQTFSSRMRFNEAGYGALLFWNLHRAYPGEGEDRVLPDMEQWVDDGSRVFAQGIRLPQRWRLRFVRAESGEQYYAMFRLLDSQQEPVCSVPAPVPNAYRTESAAISGTVDAAGIRAGLSCAADTSPESAGLYLEWTIENSGEGEARVSSADLVLNGRRLKDGTFRTAAAAGAAAQAETVLGPRDLYALDALESVSGTLTVTRGGREEKIPFTFTFDGPDLSALSGGEPLSETSQDGVTLRLLGCEPDDACGLAVYILAENGREEPFETNCLLADGIRISGSMDPLPPGMERVLRFRADNSASAVTLHISDSVAEIAYLEDFLLQSMGKQEIGAFTLWAGHDAKEREAFSLPLQAPVRLRTPEPLKRSSLVYPIFNPPESPGQPDPENLPVLAENGGLRVRLRRAVAGRDRAALVLEASNLSDRWMRPVWRGAAVNGKPCSCDTDASDLPPRSTTVFILKLNDLSLPEGDAGIREITMEVYEDYAHVPGEAAALRLTAGSPLPLGQPGGAWMNGEDFTAETAALAEDVPEPEGGPKPLEEALLLPENAGGYRFFLDTGIPPEEAAQIKNCKAAVVRRNELGYLEILTLQDLHADGEGKVVLDHPGLFPTVDGKPEIGVMTYLLPSDEAELRAEVFLPVDMSTMDMKTFALDRIRWTMDRAAGTAAVVSFEQEEAPYTAQADIMSASFLTYEVLPEPLPDGSLPHLADMEKRNDFEWFINKPGLLLQGRPLRLALRPVTAEDGLQILISVVRTDDTRYSLPLIPFPLP